MAKGCLRPNLLVSKTRIKVVFLIESQVIMDEQASHLHSTVNQLKADNKQLESSIATLQQESIELKDRIIQQESYSRRNNLRFHGLTESRFENPEDKVVCFLQSQGLNFHPRTIERAHRVGPYKEGRTRPILVRFLHNKDREVVW